MNNTLRDAEVPQTDEKTSAGSSFKDVIDGLDLLIMLAKRKKTIAVVTLLFAVTGLVISLLLPKYYPANTRILLSQRPESIAAAMLSQLSSLARAATGAGIKYRGEMLQSRSMLQSRTVADALIERFNLRKIYGEELMNDTRKMLEKNTDISLGTDGVISITVEDKERKRAADLANAYVSELSALTRRLAVTEASQRRLFYEKESQSAKDQLAKAGVELKKTQESTGMIQMDSQARTIIQSVATLRGQIAAHEVQLRVLRASSTEQNPVVIRTEEALAGMRAQLAKLEKSSNTNNNSGIQIPTGKLPSAGLEYIRKLRDVKYYETVYEILAKQYEAAKIDESKNSGVIQVLDTAVEPERKSKPRRARIVAAAALFGFILSLVWVIIQESIRFSLQRHPQRRVKVNLLRSYLAKI